MYVIILAAGKGSRLMPLTKDRPKCLLELKEGKTLLQIQIEKIQTVNPKGIIVLTGYKSKMIEEFVKKNYNKEDNIIIEFNPFFEISNNLATLYLAKSYFLKDDVIVINGDDIFTSEVIKGLAAINDEGIWATISRKNEYDWDDMKIITKGNIITHISKEIPLEEANGESVGMIKFNGKSRLVFYEVMVDVMHKPEALNWFWLHAIQEYINRGNNVYYYEIPRSSWAEMDFHVDYKSIKTYIEKYVKTTINMDDKDQNLLD